MSDYTPYYSWDCRFGAEVWLKRFASESLRRNSWDIPEDADFFDAVFEVHRVRWQVCYRLRKQFADDPDALLDFVEEHVAKKAQEEEEKAAGEGIKDVGEGD